MDLVDTHCHLNHHDYDDDRSDVIERAVQATVRRMMVIGFDMASSRRAVDLTSSEHAGAELYAVIGIHPESGDEWTEETRSELATLYASTPARIAAYGEIGLDYHWETVPRDRQQVVFVEQIEFAASLRPDPLPIIIHCRDAMAPGGRLPPGTTAMDDVLDVLKASGTRCPIVMHCFTGDVDTARRCLDAGYYLGIGGVATFKKTDDVRAAVAYAPIERLILETDCPYLAPQKWRGRRNEPSYLTAVADTVALVKGMTIDEVAASTTSTAVRLFGLG